MLSVWEILLTGVGLSMDAAAVTMSNAMVYRRESQRKLLTMPLFFGAFQALMPMLGYFAGSLFSRFISQYSGIVVFLILGFIGGKMLRDGIAHLRHPELADDTAALTYRLLVTQAIATSIDAFAVGVGFAAAGNEVFFSSLLIGVTTAVIVLGSYFLGKRFGDLLGSKAEVLGGAILLCIGIKALLGW